MNRAGVIAALGEFGMGEAEARVYIAALSLGPASVQRIAAEAQMKRTSTYAVMDTLTQRGLISVQVQGSRRRFVAEHPSQLQQLLERRRARLDEVLPDLAALFNIQGRESFLRHYQGIEGIKTVYNSMIADVHSGEDYLIITDFDRWSTLAPDFFADFAQRRAATGAKVRALLVDSPQARKRGEYGKDFGERIRYLPSTTRLLTNLVVIPKKAMIHQLVQPIMAVVIENRNVVQMHQQCFELLWRTAGE